MSQILVLYIGSLILRSIGIALVAGICSWKIRNVAMRHAIWAAVLGAILLMPVVDYLLPSSWVPARIQQIAAQQPVPFSVVSIREEVVKGSVATTPAASTAVPARSNRLNWWSIAAALYSLMALAMFIRLAIGYWKVRQLRQAGSAISSPAWDEIIALHRIRWRLPVLLESGAVQVPMTVGLVRPAVILPVDWKAWDEWKLRAVLLHEVAHIHRGDWGIAVMAAAAKCAYWLNPLAWFLERKLSQLAEQASDDASLSRTQSTARYAEILLEFAAAAQNGGRFVKGGVAMAQQNMKARIERVIGKPQSGTGFVRIAGWVLVMIIAVPVIYFASALQVASEPLKAPIPTYVAEFGRNPLPQAPAAVQQAAPQSAPAIVAKVQQDAPNPAVDPRAVAQQLGVMKQKLQEAYTANEFFREVQKYNQAYIAPVPEPQNSSDKSARTEVLKAEVAKLESQLETLKIQQAAVQQSQTNPPTPLRDALLDLPDNEGDLRAYLEKLAQLRGSQNGNSFSISITGIQGRTMNIKVAGQDYSLGCESCSFFVGESAVGSVSSTPSAPGVFVRLSSDESEVYIICHAAKCSVSEYEVLGVGSEQLSNTRQLESGLSELFRTSKRLRVVISKN